MKNIMVYVLVVLMSLPAFTGVATYISWRINQDYIAKYLCENKDKKELKCKGKCHLMKNLKKSEQQENIPLPLKLKELNLQPYIYSELQFLFVLVDMPVIDHKGISY
nr:hypothetical protein [Saprospiraceae bacterium]